MNYIPKDEKIEKYLNELSEEYKELLYKALITQSKSIEDLSISDLLRLDAEIKKPLHEDYSRIQKRRKTLFMMGEIYIFMGFFMYILFQIMISPDTLSLERIAMLMSIVMLLIGCSSILLSFISPMANTSSKYNHKVKKADLPILKYEVINKWREFEGKVNDISDSDRVKTPHSIIGFLSESHFIDDNEGKELKALLRMRNNIVHNTGVEYSETELKEMIDKSNRILSKIDKIL